MKRVIRKYEPVEPEEDTYGQRPLPIDKPFAVYGRQSTTRQLEVNDESTRDQIEGLLRRATRLEYNPALGTVYQEGEGVRGVSGRLRIDQRGDLSTVDARIRRDEIKTVFIRDEARLFRDHTGIQYNTFADTCRSHDCLVITRDYIYDFNRNPDAIRRWQRKCEAAADYITDHVAMMNRLRVEKALSGQRVIGRTPVGYMVEQERIGRKIRRKLLPYPPHAEKVEWLFRRFKELEGNISRLMREIQRMPVLFPDAPLNLPLERVVGGWTISRHGLLYLLTNPVYIGHHCVKGQVVRKYNHEAVVSEELFLYALNRLSEYDLDGNPQERVDGRPTRFQHLTTSPCEALLEDVIATETKGCGAYVHRPKKSYAVRNDEGGMYTGGFTFPLSVLDNLFSNRFTYAVKQDKRMGEGEAYRTLQQIQQTGTESSIEDQLTRVVEQIALLRAKMDATDDIILLKKWNTELRELTQIQPQLEHLLKRKDETIKTEQEYTSLLDRIREEWNSMSFEQKKQAVNTLIAKVTLSKEATHWYRVVVYWKVPQGRIDEGHIFYLHLSGTTWSTEEESVLRELYPNASREEVQHALSLRAWDAIKCKASAMRIVRTVRTENTLPFSDKVAMGDWMFAREHGLNVPENVREHVIWNTKNGEAR